MKESHFISSHYMSSQYMSSQYMSSHYMSSHYMSSHYMSSHYMSSCVISSHLLEEDIYTDSQTCMMLSSVHFCSKLPGPKLYTCDGDCCYIPALKVFYCAHILSAVIYDSSLHSQQLIYVVVTSLMKWLTLLLHGLTSIYIIWHSAVVP